MTTVEEAREGADRRSERRIRTLKSARIAFNRGHSVFDCTVRNLSPSGALLQVASTVGIPLQFEILMGPDNTRRRCRVRWLTERMIGVRFEDTTQKAA